jgi:hypothetical protein
MVVAVAGSMSAARPNTGRPIDGDLKLKQKPNAGKNGRGGQRPWLALPVPPARAKEKKCHPEH